MDYSVLLFYISILLIIYGIHNRKREKEIDRKKGITIPKIKYSNVKDSEYYSKVFNGMFDTDNRILKRV